MLAASARRRRAGQPTLPGLPDVAMANQRRAAVRGELADAVTERVLERLVPEITATVQRLVQEEVDRIRKHHEAGAADLGLHGIGRLQCDAMSAAEHPITLPEKPALEGLEDKWNAVWDAEGTYRFEPGAPRDRGLLDRHAAAHGQRLAARRPRLLLHPHRRRRALPAHARQVGLLSDGVGRQRAAHRAPRAELLRRPLRSVAAVRPVVRAAREAGQDSRSRCRAPTSSSCARG